MNAACDRCLAAIINASPAPLALVAGGVVTLANRHFADLAGLPPEKTAGCAPGALFPGLGLEGLVPETILRNHAHTVERTITVAGRQASIWAQILPVSAMEGGAALLTAVDTSALHRGQVALLQQMRKTRTDNIWVFDAELRVVYAELEPELQALRGRPDFHPLRLLQPGQEAGARQALREAKDNPGRQVSVVLRTRRESGRLITVYADIIFLRDALGSYYLCCTRTRELRGSGIVTRLKEAYGVHTDVELAQCLNTSPAMLSRARHGRRPPGDWIVRAWEDKGISADWLLTGRGNKF